MHIGLLLQIVAVGALIFIWMERKIAGRIQDRLGPTRVGPFGLLQSLADGIKLISKEDFVDELVTMLEAYLTRGERTER